MSDWFYALGSQQAGPVDDAALAGLVNGGVVGGATLVWRRGMPGWQPYAQVWAGLQAGGDAPTPALKGGGSSGEEGGGTALALAAEPRTAVAAAPPVPLARCVECGGVFPSEDTVGLHEGAVCARCKPLALQRLRECVPARSAFRFAGFWLRFGAVMLDAFIKLPVSLGMQFAFYGLYPGAMLGGRNQGAQFAGLAVLNLLKLAFEVAYEVFFIGRFGATPGKMVCGIRVVRSDGSRVTYARAFGRLMGKWLSGVILGIGYLMAAFDDQRRALHDHLADTRVVYK